MQYDKTFKEEAVRLSDEIGIKNAGTQLGISYNTLSTWRQRRKPHGLTHATTEIQEQENLIKQDFSAEKPHQKMLTDISQIPCVDGKLYISPIMDCFNGEILSLEMRNNMKKELCIDTFTNTKKRYNLPGPFFIPTVEASIPATISVRSCLRLE